MPEPRVDFKIGVDFDELDAQIGGKTQQFAAQFQSELAGKAAPAAQRVTSALQEVGVATDTAREKLRDYGAAGSVLTGIWAAWTLVSGAVRGVIDTTLSVGRAFLDAQIYAERFAITMRLATGGDAATEMDYVRGMVNRLGLELKSTAGFYASFSAAARGTALQGAQTRTVFESVAKASAVMGMSAYDTEGVFRALTQMISKGTVQAEEMRGQLGERLPGAFQIAARALGVTTAEFGKMLEQGQVISTEFLPKFAAQMNTELGGSVDQAANRTQASLNRMENAWLDFKTTVAEMGPADAIKRQADAAADAMNYFNRRMREAKAEGYGFWGKLSVVAESAEQGFIRLVNQIGAAAPLSAQLGAIFLRLAGDTDDLGTRLEKAEKKAAALRVELASFPNNIYARSDLANVERDIEAMMRAQAILSGTFTTSPGHRLDVAIDQTAFDRAEKAMGNLQKTMIAVAGVSDEYEKGMAAVNAAVDAGAISSQAAAIMQGLLAGKYTESGKAAAAAAEASARYKRELLDKIGALQDSVAASDKLTRGEKLLADLERDLTGGKAKLGKAEADAMRARLAAVIATEKQTAATIAAAKSEAELLKLDEASILTEAKRLQTIEEAVRKQQDDIAAMGLSKDALARLNVEKQQTILLDLQRKAQIPELSTAELGAIDAQITAQQRLIALMQEGAAKKATIEAAEEATKAWQKTAEQIEQSLTDALVRGFESGKDFFRSIGDYIVNYFRTTVARGIAQSLLGAVGLGASGTALAGGLGGVAGGAGGGFLGSLLGGVAGFGGAFGTGVFGGLGTLGLTSGVGLGGTLTAAGSLIGTGTAPGVISGVGMGLGAVAPYALAAYGLFKLFTGGGETRYGAQYGMRGGEVYKLEGPSGGDPNAEATMRSIAAAADTMRAAIASFGGSYVPGITRAGYEFSQESGHRFSEIFVNGVGRRLYGQGSNEEVTAAFATDLQRAVLLGLQQSNLDKPFADYFRSVDAFALDTSQIDAVLQAAGAAQSMASQVTTLGGVFTQLGDLSVEARTNILGLVGGLDQFVAKVSGYVGSFYSQSEQAAITASTIASTLQAAGVDIAGLDTKAEFRSIVDSLNLASESGQEQLAALLNVSQQFAGLTDYLAENNLTLQQLADQAPQIAVLQAIAGKSDQQTSEIKTGFIGLQNAVGLVGDVVRNTWGGAAAAIDALARRPVSVTINLPGQEVGVAR